MRSLFKGKAIISTIAGKNVEIVCDNIEVKTIGGVLETINATGIPNGTSKLMYLDIKSVVSVEWIPPFLKPVKWS